MGRILLVLLILISEITFGQNREAAEELVKEGVVYHDKGDYENAMFLYDEALKLDKNNLFALAEKSITFFLMGHFKEAINLCKTAIKEHPEENALQSIYVTYGNALDAMGKYRKALKIYNQGINLFPYYYQLHFNKGIALVDAKKPESALNSFEESVRQNPFHAASHNAIARIEAIRGKNIPSLMAFCRFLVTEPRSDRSKENLALMRRVLSANVQRGVGNNVVLYLNPKTLREIASSKRSKENDFNAIELLLTMSSALDHEKEGADETEVEKFIEKFNAICEAMKKSEKGNYGFFWDYYVPYFVDMKKYELIEPFAYIIYASSEAEDVMNWLESHQSDIDRFYLWDENYAWPGA